MAIRFINPINAAESVQEIKAAKAVGFDTETTGLSPRNGKLRLVQLAIPGTTYILDCFKYPLDLVRDVFDGETLLIGHNLYFELMWLNAAGIYLPNGKKLWDTMIAAQILAAGLQVPFKGYFSLEEVAMRTAGIVMDKTHQTSNWGDPKLSHDQYRYAAKDAWAMLPMYERQLFDIMEAKLKRTMDLEMRCLPAMVWMGETGMPLNPRKWEALADKYQEGVGSLEYTLADLTDTQTLLGWSDVNWASHEQVKREFKRNGIDLDTTDNEALTELAADGNTLAEMLIKYREWSKRYSTYGRTWLAKHYDRDTGRIFASWWQLGALRTGRMSCSDPNLQNIPHSNEYRDCFEAPEGWMFTISDLSQIELRITVEKTMDPVGIQAYLYEKSDLHVATAKLILGVSPDDPDKQKAKEARQVAKSLNFGLIYGAGAKTLRMQARTMFGLNITMERAIELRNAWRNLYKGIVAWHKSIKEGIEETRTVIGRRRLNVESYMDKLNTPVQGTGADGIKAGLALMYENRHELPKGARPCAVIHDEIIFLAPEGVQAEVEAFAKRQMETGMGAFLRKIPVLAEPKSGKTWAEK